MDRFKDNYKSFIMMFSEMIWVYYVIALFTSLEWNRPAFFDFTWLMASGIMGYVLNTLLLKKNNHVLLFLGNSLVLGLLVVQNWRSVVMEGTWGFGLAVSIGLSFIFIRSARLARRPPSRQEILRRFEGNVIYYIIFALAFAAKDWGNQTLHLLFIFAIASSLMGMIFTLQNLEDAESNQKIRIMKVGQSGWFSGALTAILICIPLFSLILILPSVNRGLYALGMSVWEKLKWIGIKIWSFVVWVIELIPVPKEGGIIGTPSEQPNGPSEMVEKTLDSFNGIWVIAVAAVLLTVIAVWFVSKLIISRQLPKSMKPRYTISIKESGWHRVKKRIKTFFETLKLKWRMSFPSYYQQSIYWYYCQLLKWGKKKGIPKGKSETSQEYIKRIIHHIPEQEVLLNRLNQDYQATYYGLQVEMSGEGEYKGLMDYFKKWKNKSH